MLHDRGKFQCRCLAIPGTSTSYPAEHLQVRVITSCFAHCLRPIGGKITHLHTKTACKAAFATSRETSQANDAYGVSLYINNVIKKIRRIIVRDCPCSQSLTIKMSEIVVRSQSWEISNRFALARGRRSTSHGRRQSKVCLRRWNMFELCANGLTMCREGRRPRCNP